MTQKYLEIVIVTASGIGEGFIRGWLRGLGDDSEIVNLEREEIERESFSERLEEFAHPGEEVLHLLVPEASRAAVTGAIAALEKEGFPAVEKTSRTYGSASADFKIEIYSREAGEAAKLALKSGENGVSIEFRKVLKETVREEAEGIELYAPEHSYELKGSGSISGEIHPVISIIETLRNLGAKTDNIKLS